MNCEAIFEKAVEAKHTKWAYVDKRTGRYVATVTKNGKSICLGKFCTQEEARRASIEYKVRQIKETVKELGIQDAKCAITNECYIVFETGHIINFHGSLVNGHMLSSGYIGTRIGGKERAFHRLVADAFVPNPRGEKCVNHIDGNKLNNNASNLEWVSYAENTQHAIKTRLHDPGKRKLSLEIAKEIRKEYNAATNEASAKSLANKYGVSFKTIYTILRNECWKE